MRVLILDRGVGNPYSLGLASGLRALGTDVLVGGPAGFDHPGVTAFYPRYGTGGERLAKLSEIPVVAGSSARALASFRPDLVHVQWPGAFDLFYTLALGRVGRLPVVYTAHNPVPRDQVETRWARRHTALLRIACRVITHGPRLQQLLAEAYPDIADRVSVIECGNYAHVVQPFPRAYARRKLGMTSGPVFTFAGQIRPRKGLEVLLEAFSLRVASGGGGSLLIAGSASSADYLALLQNRARAGAVPVTWLVSTDHLSQTTLDLAVAAATLVVLPFTAASQSASAIYAMTHGRCVLTTRVGEVSRIVEGRGLLVEPGDPQALAEAMALADDSDACELLGSRAQRYVLEELGWPLLAGKTLAVYRSVLGEGPALQLHEVTA